MDYLALAFFMGLFGSLHCAIMCGPIMLGMPFKKQNVLESGLQLLLYQFGRVLIYTLLGVMVGALGTSIKVFSNQKTLSLVIGLVLIVFTALQFSRAYRSRFQKIQLKTLNPISKWMGKVFNLPVWGLFAGMLNGLIPCGMVYLALATALNTGSIKSGAVFMFLFGLGTTPLMMMISLGGIFLKKYIRFNTQKLVPWFMFFMGLLLVLRAADLGIPFLSPITTNTYGHTLECK
ncbi:sulfite exporter TauE/SafE family protein [Pedobacter yonginense]|uniref:Sulfite exporter TauE/SafE family protein n=1 Tax=Pedobacter yonginense TaxID=651869 RepID=A0A317EQW2_9SPHI|nr:sulfite exporter TauE/SafE family protein [Pedobacter yonginense]PWS28775.1 sulfite exporter TauE/SafE family protein [Pedobacter yonginense]